MSNTDINKNPGNNQDSKRKGFAKRDTAPAQGSLVSDMVKETKKSRVLSLVGEDSEIESWGDVFKNAKTLKDICDGLALIKTNMLPNKKELELACCNFMNKHYSFVYQGGKSVIVWKNQDEYSREKYEFTSVTQMVLFMSNMRAPFQKKKDDSIVRAEIKVMESFIVHEESNRYLGVTFAPGGDVPNGYFNLFSGFKIKPIDGLDKCQSTIDHIFENLCNGNKTYFDYFMGWLAHLVQKPMEKPEVAIVLRSNERGTGKSTVGEKIIEHILGNCYKKVSQPSQLTGKFNGHLSDCLFLMAEESVFCGDHQAVGILNDLITSNTISVERKGADVCSMRSCMRLMMVTNSEFAAPASSDERRYFVLDVNPQRAQDRKYFGKINSDLNNGGREQFFNLLLSMDISNFDVRTAPHTEALRNQIELAMSIENKYIENWLTNGCEVEEYDIGYGIPKDAIHKEYVQFHKDHGFGKPLTKMQFGKKFMTLFGDVADSNQKVEEKLEFAPPAKNKKRLNAYKFINCDIKKLREIFIIKLNLNDDIFDN